MLGADDVGDVVADPLGEGGRGTICRDGDRNWIAADDRREDEVTELGGVDDVAQNRARTRVARDLAIDAYRRGRCDDKKATLKVGRVATALEDRDVELSKLVANARCDDRNVRAALDEAVGLLEGHGASAYDKAASALE